MDKKTIGIIILGVAAAGVVLYLLKDKLFPASGAIGKGVPDSRGAISTDDEDTYKQMLDVLKAEGGNLTWLYEIAADMYAGKKSISDFHKVGGKLTKSGALLQAFESTTANEESGLYNKAIANGTKKATESEKKALKGQGYPTGWLLWSEDTHVKMWNLFNDFKGRSLTA